jgi:2-polyprenyl-3-methyl-5-hydroxy-6-metoxy-1,4-benzoquinol methylase
LLGGSDAYSKEAILAMTQIAMEHYYTQKDANYFSYARREILPLLPAKFSKIFELGCGDGSTLRMVKSYFNIDFCAGLDIDKKAAEIAGRNIDLTLCGNIEAGELPDAIRDIDVILCLDVLEHLVDPWRTVRKLHERLSPQGIIIASIPNVRYFRASLPLVLAGRWELQEQGILDRTHLRFFVKKTAIELMTCTGLHLHEVRSTGLEKGRKARLANLATLKAFEGFLTLQYLVRVGRQPSPAQR